MIIIFIIVAIINLFLIIIIILASSAKPCEHHSQLLASPQAPSSESAQVCVFNWYVLACNTSDLNV